MKTAETPNPELETSLLDELKLGYEDLTYKEKDNLHDWIIAKRIEETKDRLAEKMNEVQDDAKDLLDKGTTMVGENIVKAGNRFSKLFNK